MRRVVAGLGAGLLLAAAPLTAHHAFSSEFDINKPFKFRGMLTKWEMINPHSWFHFDVKGDDGSVAEWMIEGGSPNSLIKQGVTKHTLAVGTEMLIEGYQAKDGTNKGVGRNLVLADGRRLFLGGESNLPDKKPDGK
jgi:hypothetical protein